MSRNGRAPSYNVLRLRAWNRTDLRPDVFAGLSVAAYLVPQVMAYATLAGLEPVAGLWACLLPLTLYAVVGTSRMLSVGPESTTAILTAAALAPLALGDPAQYAAMATLCCWRAWAFTRRHRWAAPWHPAWPCWSCGVCCKAQPWARW